MTGKWQVLLYSGIVAIALYLSLAATSYFYYPKAYSPFTNWLSDLGNPAENPSGAVFYNLAGILTGLTLIIFFVGLYELNSGERKMKVLLTVSQVTGIVGALCFATTAVFPLGVNDYIHSVFSVSLFIWFGLFEAFSSSALRRKPSCPRWVIYTGFAVAVASFLIGITTIFVDFFLGEWITVAALMIYIITLVLGEVF